MDTKTKIEAIVEFATDTVAIKSGLYDEFFEYNDLGIPLAIAINAEIAIINEAGIKVIDETFTNLCLTMEIDPNKEYKNFDEMLEEPTKDLDPNHDLFQKVSALWDLLTESFWFDNQCSLETFLGAHYAQAAIAGDCSLTDSGLEVVKSSKVEMIELLKENDEDFDESNYL